MILCPQNFVHSRNVLAWWLKTFTKIQGCKILPDRCSCWEPQCWTGAGAADVLCTGSQTNRGDSTPVCPFSSTQHGTCVTAGRSAGWGSGRGWRSVWIAGNKAVAQAPPALSRCSADGVHACPGPHRRTPTHPRGQRGSGWRSHNESGWRGTQLKMNRGKEEIRGITAGPNLYV